MQSPLEGHSGSARRILAALLCLLSSAGPGAALARQEPAAPASKSSHQRMMEALDEVGRKAREDNPFMGENKARDLRARWESRKDKAGPFERWTVGQMLGNEELKLGNEEAAIAALEVAVVAVDQVKMDNVDRSKLPKEDAKVEDLRNYYHNQTWFDLGVAYMRLGETQNCCLRHNGESCILPLRNAALHTAEEGSRGAIRCFLEVLKNRPAKPDPIETKDCFRPAQWL